ncbi:sodium-dependent transporter, partial [bacterium]|nr:sodium-dependent transporter [bacterium]
MAQNSRGQWNSSLGFVLAAAGSAIGLGNLWKFPYITYENHGGAFVLVYIAAIALVGLPIMLAEIVLGRKAQRDPVGSFRILGQGRPGGGAWAGTGFLGVVAGFVILSYYSVIAGWTIRYVLLAVSGGLGEMVEADRLNDFFGAFLADGPQQ